jgi:hypothetical protein
MGQTGLSRLDPALIDAVAITAQDALPLLNQGQKGMALWYSPGCKILVLSTAYVNISTFQYPEKRVQ